MFHEFPAVEERWLHRPRLELLVVEIKPVTYAPAELPSGFTRGLRALSSHLARAEEKKKRPEEFRAQFEEASQCSGRRF